MNKLCTLAEAISLVHDGDSVGLGGNTLNRAPMAAVFELIRQGRKNLRVVKTAGAMDVDALCLGGCAGVVDAGFVSYESQYGLAQRYRSFVQKGLVRANEHACYTVISALRAASYGIPFMPVRGLKVSDLRRVNDYFADVTDPFTGETLAAVQAIRPDFAIVHAQTADANGNACFEGPPYFPRGQKGDRHRRAHRGRRLVFGKRTKGGYPALYDCGCRACPTRRVPLRLLRLLRTE